LARASAARRRVSLSPFRAAGSAQRPHRCAVARGHMGFGVEICRVVALAQRPHRGSEFSRTALHARPCLPLLRTTGNALTGNRHEHAQQPRQWCHGCTGRSRPRRSRVAARRRRGAATPRLLLTALSCAFGCCPALPVSPRRASTHARVCRRQVISEEPEVSAQEARLTADSQKRKKKTSIPPTPTPKSQPKPRDTNSDSDAPEAEPSAEPAGSTGDARVRPAYTVRHTSSPSQCMC
jgi:hypothetical protein